MTETTPFSRVYLDTNIFVGAFESDDQTSRDLRALFERLEAKRKCAVTSELTLVELAVRGGPSRRFYLGLIVTRGFVDLVPVSREILLETGTFRALLKRSGRRVELPDAIHCVTAVRRQCRFVLSADKRFAVPRPLQRIAPDSAGLAIINQALDA